MKFLIRNTRKKNHQTKSAKILELQFVCKKCKASSLRDFHRYKKSGISCCNSYIYALRDSSSRKHKSHFPFHTTYPFHHLKFERAMKKIEAILHHRFTGAEKDSAAVELRLWAWMMGVVCLEWEKNYINFFLSVKFMWWDQIRVGKWCGPLPTTWTFACFTAVDTCFMLSCLMPCHISSMWKFIRLWEMIWFIFGVNHISIFFAADSIFCRIRYAHFHSVELVEMKSKTLNNNRLLLNGPWNGGNYSHLIFNVHQFLSFYFYIYSRNSRVSYFVVIWKCLKYS